MTNKDRILQLSDVEFAAQFRIAGGSISKFLSNFGCSNGPYTWNVVKNRVEQCPDLKALQKLRRKSRHSYTVSDVRQIAQSVLCFSDVLKALNLVVTTGNYRTIRAFCYQHHIDITHFNTTKAIATNSGRLIWNKDTIFCKDSKYARSSLPSAARRYKILPSDRCSLCGQGIVWNEIHLNLELDHINGDPSDHRIENLRWICPNCHSQTLTFRGRKRCT